MLRKLALPAVLLLSSSVAMASPSGPDAPDPSTASSSVSVGSKIGAGLHSSSGLLEALGVAGAIGGATAALQNHSAGEKYVPVKAPEISTSGTLSGLTLLLGGGLIVRGRRRAQV